MRFESRFRQPRSETSAARKPSVCSVGESAPGPSKVGFLSERVRNASEAMTDEGGCDPLLFRHFSGSHHTSAIQAAVRLPEPAYGS
jgi:hypothetical protein